MMAVQFANRLLQACLL